MTASPCRNDTENMFRNDGIMNLDCINTYLAGKDMLKIYRKEVPIFHYDLFASFYHIGAYLIITQEYQAIHMCH